MISVEQDEFRLCGDEGKPYLYPISAFEIVDSSLDPDWIVDETYDDYYCGPRELQEAGLFEDYFDGDRKAKEIVEIFVRRCVIPTPTAQQSSRDVEDIQLLEQAKKEDAGKTGASLEDMMQRFGIADQPD